MENTRRLEMTMAGWMRSAVLALAVVLSLVGVRAYGQSQNTGAVAGVVADAQGAVIPGAVVVLSDSVDGRKLTTKSNAKGEYQFNAVPVGTYTLKVTAATFEAYVVNEIAVDAATNVRTDAQMVPGAVDATVTVQAAGTTIDTRSATLGTMIDPQMVESLPVDGENVVSLAALLPGVSNVSAPTTFTSDTGGPTYSVSGSRGNQNLFLMDGLIWNNVFYNTGLNYPPRLALEEVSVLLNNYKAQYGRNSGSIFNVLTRRGTNTIHGNVWEYFQNSALDAADYLTHINPHLVQNQFGATIGGPIKRDKAFFFLAYQDLRLAGQVTAVDQTQTLAELGFDAPGVQHNCTSGPFAGKPCGNYVGDFCYVVTSQCLKPVTLATSVKNPIYVGGSVAVSEMNTWWQQTGHTGTNPCVTDLTSYMASQTSSAGMEYLPTPELPTECFNPLTLGFLNKYIPVANQYIAGSSSLSAISIANQPRNDQEGLARVDWNLGKHNIDARFYVTNVNDVTSNSVSQGVGVANYEQDKNVAGIYAGNIRDAFVVTPNILNVSRAGYKRYTYIITPMDRTTWSDLGANYTQPGHSFLPKVEATDRFTVGSLNSSDSYTMTANQEYDDDLSWTHGNHNVQVGAQFLNLDYVHRFDQTPFFEAEQQNTEVAIADFLVGMAYVATVGNATNLAARQYALYLYAQDDWRATSRLTLNYGLRYELPFSWKEIDGEGVTFKPGYQSIVFPTSPSNVAFQNDPGIGNPSPKTRYTNWGPRVGFAYDVYGNGNTSIRGGFGVFYDSINANVVGISEPYHYTANYTSPAGGFTQPLQGLPQIPQNYVKGAPAQFTLPYTINYADPNLKNPYTLAANIGFQQRIAKGATLEVNYVGKFGRHGMIPFDQNPSIYDCTGSFYQANPNVYCNNAAATQASYEARSLYPGFNYGGQGIVDNASIGSSSYNGLQAIYSQKALRNVNIYASYAYSRSVDYSSNGVTNTANVPQPNHMSLEYAASDFNATHIFNMGWIVSLPGLKGATGWRGAVLNNWKYGGIYNARTGNPINVTIAGDASLTDERTQRPNLVANQPLYVPGNRHRLQKVNEWFNTAAFVTPATGTFGNLRRNALVGPAFINTQMDLQKMFTVHRGQTLEFRIDAFNVFNTPNLSPPNASLSSSTSNQVASNFGKILSTVGTNGAVGTNGRRVQLGLIFRY